MDDPQPAFWSLSKVLLALGLLGMGAAFMMRGNNWLATAPIMGIQHPIAAGVGALGIVLCLASIALRRFGPGGGSS